MAGDWIKMRCELGRDPDVIQIASIVGIDEFGVVGRLHAVWSWLDAHSQTGTNVRIVTAFLDRMTACPGFAEAMRTVGWLGGRDGNLTFPNYAVHNGESAKTRASGAKRKQNQRNKREKCPADDGTNVPQKVGPEKRREEKKEGTPLPPSAPPSESEPEPKPLCTIQQAVQHCPMARMSPQAAEYWWHTRNAAGWTRSSASGGHPRRITSWQSDMASSREWAEEGASKARNTTSGGKPIARL